MGSALRASAPSPSSTSGATSTTSLPAKKTKFAKPVNCWPQTQAQWLRPAEPWPSPRSSSTAMNCTRPTGTWPSSVEEISTPSCWKKYVAITRPVLLLHLRTPVEDDGQRRRIRLVHFCIDQKLLPIAGHLIGKHDFNRNCLSLERHQQHTSRT